MLGCLYIKKLQILFKRALIFVGKFLEAFEIKRQALALETLDHFVVALVGIGREVSDIGNIYDLRNFKTGVLERAAEDVGENVRAQIADVRPVVNRRAAVIEPRLSRLYGLEYFELARERVVES